MNLRQEHRIWRNAGWFNVTILSESFKVLPRSNAVSYGKSATAGLLALTHLYAFTIMRDVAHIMSSGLTSKIDQHASVISGTSSVSSISGKRTGWDSSKASTADSHAGIKASLIAAPLPSRFQSVRPAICTLNPLSLEPLLQLTSAVSKCPVAAIKVVDVPNNDPERYEW